MQIRNLNQNDIDSLIEIDKKIFLKFNEKKEVFKDRIRTFPKGCLGQFDQNKMIGYVTSELWLIKKDPEMNVLASTRFNSQGKILFVSSIGVIPERRGQGIGTKLVKKLIDFSQNNNFNEIYLRTEHARNFFEKLGFKFICYDKNSKRSMMSLKID